LKKQNRPRKVIIVKKLVVLYNSGRHQCLPCGHAVRVSHFVVFIQEVEMEILKCPECGSVDLFKEVIGGGPWICSDCGWCEKEVGDEAD